MRNLSAHPWRTVARTVLMIAVGATVFAITSPAHASPGASASISTDRTGNPTPDEVERSWFNFGKITLYVALPAGDPNGPPPPPDPALPNADIFLIAPIDATNPQDPGVVIPSPPAPFLIIVPVHDTVVTQPRDIANRANCFGVQVLAGPKASTATVLTRPDPNGGATLAYALRFGPITIPLNNAHVILIAERLGLLTLDRTWPGYGGTCWTGKPGQWPPAA